MMALVIESINKHPSVRSERSSSLELRLLVDWTGRTLSSLERFRERKNMQRSEQGSKANLWDGLKAKAHRRSCTLRFFFCLSLSVLRAASWWLRLTWLWPSRLGAGSFNSTLLHSYAWGLD